MVKLFRFRSAEKSKSESVNAAYLLTFLTLVAGIQLRFGYSAGLSDQFVLSPLGISWADKSAFKNDYFVENAIQPHIFFDWFTKIGYSSGHLSSYYLFYWILTLAVASIAIVKFAEFLSRENVLISSLLGALLLTAGPVTLFGTTTIALPQALPHALGGAICFLAVSLALRKEWLGAGICVVFATVAHVQHGSVAIAIIALLLIMNFRAKRQILWFPIFCLILSMGIFALILSIRPVIGNFSDFIKVCNEYIPYHCNATSWLPNRFVTGLATFSIILIAASNRKVSSQDNFKDLSQIAISATIALISLDYLDVPVFGGIVQAINAYRINSIFISIGALCGAWILVNAKELSSRTLALALSSIYVFLTATGDESHLAPYSFIVASILFWFYFTIVESNGKDKNWNVFSISLPKTQAKIFVALALVAIMGSGLTLPRFRPNFMSDYAKSFKIEHLVPSGSTIVANPSWTWVRLASKRAVIVDCKYIPYGGVPLTQFENRLDEIGGYDEVCSGNSFDALTPQEIDSWASRFNGKYLLLSKSDKRINKLMSLGWSELNEPEANKIEIRRSYDGQRIRLVLLHKINS